MKTNTHFLLYLGMALLLAGCRSEEQEPEKKSVAEMVPTIVQYKDTVERNMSIGRLQSNPSFILSGSIECKNGKMVLNMTREQADSLGIPEDTYNRFEQFVENYNK